MYSTRSRIPGECQQYHRHRVSTEYFAKADRGERCKRAGSARVAEPSWVLNRTKVHAGELG
jgi:hypothetical protein